MNQANQPLPIERLREIVAIDVANCNVTVCLASVQNDKAVPVFARLQLTDELADQFREVVREVFQRRAKEVDSKDTVLHSYDAGAKLEPHEIEFLDISAHPFIVQQLESLSSVSGVSLFQHSQEFIEGLHFYVLVLQPAEGEQIYCFRSYSPKKELSRSSIFAATFDDGQFDKIRKPTLLFDGHLDCVSRGNALFIFNKDAFQKMFRFFEMVRKAASRTLEKIKKAIPIANFDDFAQACEAHLYKLAKLNNIACKPYLNTVTMADMRRVIKKCGLNIETVKKNGKEMIVFDKSDKWAILRLLDDDYLASVMTGRNYEANSKRAIG